MFKKIFHFNIRIGKRKPPLYTGDWDVIWNVVTGYLQAKERGNLEFSYDTHFVTIKGVNCDEKKFREMCKDLKRGGYRIWYRKFRRLLLSKRYVALNIKEIEVE